MTFFSTPNQHALGARLAPRTLNLVLMTSSTSDIRVDLIISMYNWPALWAEDITHAMNFLCLRFDGSWFLRCFCCDVRDFESWQANNRTQTVTD